MGGVWSGEAGESDEQEGVDAAMSTRDAGNSGSPDSTSGAGGVAELDTRVTAMLDQDAPDAPTSLDLEQRVEAALTHAQQALSEMTALGEPRAERGAQGTVHAGVPNTPDQVNRPEAVPADIRTLDQQLSSTAERAIESDFGDAVSVLGLSRTPDAPATEATEPAAPAPGMSHGVADGVDARRGPEPATPSAAVAEPTPALSSAAKTTAPSGEPAQHVQPARPPANEPGDRAREARDKPASSAPSAPSVPVEPRPSVISAVVTMVMTPVMRSVEPLAARLASLSPGARQTMAWLALLTAFNAGVTWVYVLTRGTPDRAATLERQPTIVGSPAAPQGHAQPAEPERSPSAGRREIHGSR